MIWKREPLKNEERKEKKRKETVCERERVRMCGGARRMDWEGKGREWERKKVKDLGMECVSYYTSRVYIRKRHFNKAYFSLILLFSIVKYKQKCRRFGIFFFFSPSF